MRLELPSLTAEKQTKDEGGDEPDEAKGASDSQAEKGAKQVAHREPANDVIEKPKEATKPKKKFDPLFDGR